MPLTSFLHSNWLLLMPYNTSLSSIRRQLTTVTSNFKYSNHQSLSVIQSCKTIQDLRQIHAQLIRTDQIKDTFIATKFLEFCAVSAKNIDYAVRIFNNINYPNAYTWTTMIRGFLLIKNSEKAIEFYDLMRSLDVKPTKFTFVFVLKAYSLIPSFQEGNLVHGKLVKLGFCYDVFLCNGLIYMYSKCGDMRSARNLFDEMPERNVVNWNTMIVACFDCGDIEGARKLFDEMPERNVESWNAMINGYSKWNYVDVARSLFDLTPEKDLFSWSGMISSYVGTRRAKEALELFKDMQNSGVKPDSVTMVSVLAACSQIGALEMGRWIHAYVGRNKLKYDVFLGTSLVDMYAKCGCIDIALQVFNSMPRRNICSWNAILCGLALNGFGENALELFKRMESEHVNPNDVTFVGVLCACCHIGSVDESRRQFNRMVAEFGIAPKIEHFGCMVDILGRAGLIDEARELVQNMPMDPNIVVLGALLSACRIHGVKDVGEDVLKQLHKLEPGDGGCYVLLSNINAAENRWDEVMTMRKMMRDMGVEKKIPGCSSIEVNSMVHQFLAEDKLHPNWREVYEAIDRLSTHLEFEGYVPTPSLFMYNIDV